MMHEREMVGQDVGHTTYGIPLLLDTRRTTPTGAIQRNLYRTLLGGRLLAVTTTALAAMIGKGVRASTVDNLDTKTTGKMTARKVRPGNGVVTMVGTRVSTLRGRMRGTSHLGSGLVAVNHLIERIVLGNPLHRGRLLGGTVARTRPSATRIRTLTSQRTREKVERRTGITTTPTITATPTGKNAIGVTTTAN